MATPQDDLPIKHDYQPTSFPMQDYEQNAAEDGTDSSLSGARQNLKAYVIASQVTFVVLTPLLLFIGGGTWLVRQLALPNWLNIVFIILGIIVMLSSLASYLAKLIRMYDKDKKDEYRKLKTDKKDFDY